MRVKIKPLSSNRAWQGRRFKSKDYDAYEKELFYMLPKMEVPKGKLELNITFGFSNKASDIDNPVKPFIDILQKKYRFNDKQIYSLIIEKEDVRKNADFIDFEINGLE